MQRRNFIKNVAATSAAFSIVPSYVLGKIHTAPSDILYMGAFGVGGRGAGVIQGLNATKKVKFTSNPRRVKIPTSIGVSVGDDKAEEAKYNEKTVEEEADLVEEEVQNLQWKSAPKIFRR